MTRQFASVLRCQIYVVLFHAVPCVVKHTHSMFISLQSVAVMFRVILTLLAVNFSEAVVVDLMDIRIKNYLAVDMHIWH